jgi:hypothetical protein
MIDTQFLEIGLQILSTIPPADVVLKCLRCLDSIKVVIYKLLFFLY